MDIIVAVFIPGRRAGERIGLVKFYESGYYPTTLDRVEWTPEQARKRVEEFNSSSGVPNDVAESAMDASMFGWHVPAAKKAIEFFKQKTLQA